MKILLRPRCASKLADGLGPPLQQVSGWFKTILVSAGMISNGSLIQRYSYLVIELSRGTILLGQISRRGFMIVLALTLLAIAVAQIINGTAANPQEIKCNV